jgi:hypothetical protein
LLVDLFEEYTHFSLLHANLHSSAALMFKRLSISPFLSSYFFNENLQQKNAIKFIFINVANQEPDGQLQRQHNEETKITNDNQQDTCEIK